MSDAVMEEIVSHVNLTPSELVEHALQREEGVQASNKALRVLTGNRTGRSPKDRYIVEDALTKDSVEWGAVNQPINPEVFERLWSKAIEHVNTREHYVSHLRVGADETHFLPVEVITELAWHNLFARNLFVRPEGDFAKDKPLWTLLNAASLKTNPMHDETQGDGAVMINFSQKKVLLCGMMYAGEMKKAMFSALNFILPELDVLPMHCAANVGQTGDVALFFGLSGTGKTTLSADPKRYLIGDDEHGWSSDGVFNFEGGCYAKCIDLSPEREPLIHAAIHSGAIMENVVLQKETKLPDYSDSRYTKNTRAAYPREHIPQRAEQNFGQNPSAVIFLCCDLYGVLPPVARLTQNQAAYYFLSGYTALVGSTEVGQTQAIQPTFSTCFGAPFFPRPANVYADLLLKRLQQTQAPVYLVNTGWTGGSYGQGGHRFEIPMTRAIISGILASTIEFDECEKLPDFNLYMPKKLSGVEDSLLDPRNNWSSQEQYQQQSRKLIEKFIENFNRFEVSSEIREAGPSF